MARNFKNLSEREILALAIHWKRKTAALRRLCRRTARNLSATAALFDDMGAEESGHRASLIATIAALRRAYSPDPAAGRQGLRAAPSVWLTRPLKIAEVRKQAEIMELETRSSIKKRSGKSPMPAFANCSAIWRKSSAKHQITARLWKRRSRQMSRRRRTRHNGAFCIADRAPGLGRTDGWLRVDPGSRIRRCVCHQSSHDALLVGLAASIVLESPWPLPSALRRRFADGRGRPVLRGRVTGLMTAAGGIGHTLPFLMKTST